jgi:hypothetical protein
LRDRSELNVNFIPKEINNNLQLRIQDLLDEGGSPLALEETENVIGTDLTVENYNLLRTGLVDSLKLLKKTKIAFPVQRKTITEFLASFKKGSKPFRKYLDRSLENKINIRQKTTVKTFFKLINVPIIPDQELEKFLMLWGYEFLPNKLREFIYKFRSNLLGLNSRVAHFNNNISRNCTFCREAGANPCPDETFIYLFYDCNVTKETISRVKTTLIPELIGVGTDREKKFFFTGTNFLTGKVDNIFIELLSAVIMFSIWQCKLSKSRPTVHKITDDICFFLNQAKNLNNGVCSSMTLNLQLCRNWTALISSRE